MVAVGHSLLVVLHRMLQDGVEYREMGADHLNWLEPERLRYLVKRQQRPGYDERVA